MAQQALNDKQRKFVEQYALTKNATQAAVAAGYSPKTAGVQAYKMLKLAHIREYLLGLTAAAEQRIATATDGVVATLTEVLGYQTSVMRAATPDQDPNVVRNGLKAAAGLQSHYEGDKLKGAGVTITVEKLLMLSGQQPGLLGDAARRLLSGENVQ